MDENVNVLPVIHFKLQFTRHDRIMWLWLVYMRKETHGCRHV